MKIKSLLKVFVLMAVVLTAVGSLKAQEIEVTNSELFIRSENNYGVLKFYDSGHMLLNQSSSATSDYAFTINVTADESRAFTVRKNWASPAKFEVWGDGTVKANNQLITSDSTLKEEITPLGTQIEKLKKLKSVSYKFKDKGIKGDNLTFGLLAQDLEKIYPDMVFTDESGEKGIYYIELIPVLLQVAQEQQNEIEQLQGLLLDMESRLSKLEKKDK